MLISWWLIHTTPVQNWLVKKVTKRLSKDLETRVSIKYIDFALFDEMLMEGTLVEDRKRDTLLYAGKVKVNITDWFFLKDTIQLKYIGLEDATVNMHRIDSVWNYQFLVDYFSAPPSAKKKKS